MKESANRQSYWPFGSLFYGLIAAIALITVIMTYATVRLDLQENVSFAQLLLVKLSILLPVLFIWVVAARGARRFKDYAYLIRKSPEGDGMNRVANGLLLLVVYIIVLNAVGNVVILFQDSDNVDLVIALTNHLPIIFALLATGQLVTGSIRLVEFTKSQYWNKIRIIKLLTVFLLFLIPFAINFYFRAPDLVNTSGLPRFALPANALLFTYVLPHSLVWLFGVISVVNLSRYAEYVSGKIYKALFRDFYKGVILVYLCIFFAQLIMLSPIIATNFSLGLIFIYGVLMLAITGFQYIFRGARKLQLIEETI